MTRTGPNRFPHASMCLPEHATQGAMFAVEHHDQTASLILRRLVRQLSNASDLTEAEIQAKLSNFQSEDTLDLYDKLA